MDAARCARGLSEGCLRRLDESEGCFSSGVRLRRSLSLSWSERAGRCACAWREWKEEEEERTNSADADWMEADDERTNLTDAVWREEEADRTERDTPATSRLALLLRWLRDTATCGLPGRTLTPALTLVPVPLLVLSLVLAPVPPGVTGTSSSSSPPSPSPSSLLLSAPALGDSWASEALAEAAR